jgi:integrase
MGGGPLFSIPDAHGLSWTSRRHDHAQVVMLFGTRIKTSDLTIGGPSTVLLRDSNPILPVVDLATKLGATLGDCPPKRNRSGSTLYIQRSHSTGKGITTDSVSDWAVWSVVEQSSKQIGIERFGAHALRRTCAKLCQKNGGDLEQSSSWLDHSSIQNTERYLGSEQEIAIAVNDKLGCVGSQGERLSGLKSLGLILRSRYSLVDGT